MRLIISIEMDNAAFEDDSGAVVVKILRTVPRRLVLTEANRIRLRDSNGNTVGFAKVED